MDSTKEILKFCCRIKKYCIGFHYNESVFVYKAKGNSSDTFAKFDVSKHTSPMTGLTNWNKFRTVVTGNKKCCLQIQTITDLLHNDNESIKSFVDNHCILGVPLDEAMITARPSAYDFVDRNNIS